MAEYHCGIFSPPRRPDCFGKRQGTIPPTAYHPGGGFRPIHHFAAWQFSSDPHIHRTILLNQPTRQHNNHPRQLGQYLAHNEGGEQLCYPRPERPNPDDNKTRQQLHNPRFLQRHDPHHFATREFLSNALELRCKLVHKPTRRELHDPRNLAREGFQARSHRHTGRQVIRPARPCQSSLVKVRNRFPKDFFFFAG